MEKESEILKKKGFLLENSLENSPGCQVFHHPGKALRSLGQAISEAHDILIVGHNNPDGDAVGSTLSLYSYLKNEGKNAWVVYPNHCANNLLWMDEDDIILNYVQNKAEVEDAVNRCDLMFMLDFNRLSRTEGLCHVLEAKEVNRIMIDHHLEPQWDILEMGYSDTTVSSTCELLYRIFCQELEPKKITPHIANCLYAGMSTDTGSFSYSCRHKELFEAIAHLIQCGLDTVKVHQNIFDNFSENRLRMLGCCLGERLIVKPEYHTAYMYMTSDDMKKYNYQSGDTEGIVNYGLSIAGISFAAFFTQRDGRIRMSFRSQGEIDVNLFARDNFNGGGHKNAAGGLSHDSLEEVLAKFEKALPDFFEKGIKPFLPKERKHRN